METVEKKVAESEDELEDESEVEEGAAEVEIEADLGELLKEASKNDIRLKLVSNSGESQATATVNRQDEGSESKRWVAIGAVSFITVVVFLALILEYYPQQGFSVMLGAIGGIFGNIVNIMLHISEALKEVIPNRYE